MARSEPFAASPIAFVSDIHGNLVALEAVLEELDRRGVRQLVALGDHLLGGPDPLGVWRRLKAMSARMARGPSDLALAQVDAADLVPRDAAEQDKARVFAETRHAIGDLVVEQLRRLPDQVRIPLMDGGELVAVHGSPADPFVECSHAHTDEELASLLGDDPADLVLCGASHVPFDRTLAGVRVVNVGTVGQAPDGRVAHFTVVVPAITGAEVSSDWVRY